MVKHLLRGLDLTSQGPTNPFIRLGLDKCLSSCMQGIKVFGKHFTCCCTTKCWHLVCHYVRKIWILPKNKLIATKPMPHLKTVFGHISPKGWGQFRFCNSNSNSGIFRFYNSNSNSRAYNSNSNSRSSIPIPIPVAMWNQYAASIHIHIIIVRLMVQYGKKHK